MSTPENTPQLQPLLDAIDRERNRLAAGFADRSEESADKSSISVSAINPSEQDEAFQSPAIVESETNMQTIDASRDGSREDSDSSTGDNRIDETGEGGGTDQTGEANTFGDTVGLAGKNESTALRYFKQFLKVIKLSLLVGFAGLIILSCTIIFFGRQILDSADHELNKNLYWSIPLKGLVDPLIDGDSASRAAYFSSLKKAVKGYIYSYRADNQKGPPGAYKTSNGQVYRHYIRGEFDKISYVSIDELEASLNELKKSHKNSPLSAYVAYALVTEKLAHPAVNKGSKAKEADLLAARQLVSEMLGPKNFMMAAADYQLAKYYMLAQHENLEKAENSCKSSLEIDQFGAGQNSIPAWQDQQLLTSISIMHDTRPVADKKWNDFIALSKKVYGNESLMVANVLVAHARYLLDTQRFNQSTVEAARSFVIIQKSNHESLLKQFSSLVHINLFSRYWIGEDIFLGKKANTDFQNYMEAARNALSTLSGTDNSSSARQNFYDLENKYLDWTFANNEGAHRRRCFDLLVKIGDDYQRNQLYDRADTIYKRALKVGDQYKMLKGSNNPRAPINRNGELETYILCMAKTAHNSILLGNSTEGALIAHNVLKMQDPYKTWHSSTNFQPVLQELVYALGPIPQNKRTAEIKQVNEVLVETLKLSDYNRHNIRRSNFHSSLTMLAEFFELQGDDTQAEHYYRQNAQNKNDPDDVVSNGVLAAFLLKRGRLGEAGPLLQLSEKNFEIRYKQRISPKNQTVINLVRLKQILESAPNLNFSKSRNFLWYESITKDIARSNTSARLGNQILTLDLRPFVRDVRDVRDPEQVKQLMLQKPSARATGTVYKASSARKDFAQLSKDQLKTVQEKLSWYKDCYPTARANWNLPESLPATPLPGLLGHPNCLRDLEPEVILVISNEDAAFLERLLGRKLANSS